MKNRLNTFNRYTSAEVIVSDGAWYKRLCGSVVRMRAINAGGPGLIPCRCNYSFILVFATFLSTLNRKLVFGWVFGWVGFGWVVRHPVLGVLSDILFLLLWAFNIYLYIKPWLNVSTYLTYLFQFQQKAQQDNSSFIWFILWLNSDQFVFTNIRIWTDTFKGLVLISSNLNLSLIQTKST